MLASRPDVPESVQKGFKTVRLRRQTGPAVIAFLCLLAFGFTGLAVGGCSSGTSTTLLPTTTASSMLDNQLGRPGTGPEATASTATLATEEPSTEVSGTTRPTAAAISPPGTYNLVILGNDTREPTVAGKGSSDIIMMLHVDSARDFLSVLSVTRDLYVDIPGIGMNKINAAYAEGRAPLAMQTLESVFGVDVTEYVELGFNSFAKVIDSLGGVYVDVDRLYNYVPYNRVMDIAPGYQLLSGADALLWARYRSDKNADFGRMMRQQWILAGLREQATGWDVAAKGPALIGAALDGVGTNMTPGELLSLVNWVVHLDGSRMKQSEIVGPGEMIDEQAVVVVPQATLDAAAADFLRPPDPTAVNFLQPSEREAAAGGAPTADLSITRPVSLLAPSTTTSSGPPTTLGPSVLGESGWRAIQKHVPFPLEMPRYLPTGFAYLYKWPEGDGVYDIDGSGQKPAVRMVYRYQDTDDYLGITATTWVDAPVAAHGVEVSKNGTTYHVVGTNGKVHHIWWKHDSALYFISNTLMLTLGREELLKMAESMVPVLGSLVP
jgi:LCP family protein required for cell wall assembly